MLSCSFKRAPDPLAKHAFACSIDQLLQQFCEQEKLEQALQLLALAHSSPVSHQSYLFLLKTCNRAKNLTHARCIYAHLTLCGPHVTDALGNPLVVTLAKCGALEEAIRLLYSLMNRTVFSWTAVISAYTDSDRASEALQTYAIMLDDGIQPDLYTFVSLFKACGSIRNLTEGMRMHADAHLKGFTSNAFARSSLVSMYGKCERLDEAESVFAEMPEHDMVSWSAMLSAYVDLGFGRKALQLYRQMQEEFRSPVKVLLVLALQACGCLGEEEDLTLGEEQSVKVVAFDIGRAIHAAACKRGFSSDVFIASALIHMYSKCGEISYAEYVFAGFSVPDHGMWNAMLSAYVEQSQAIRALQLYRHLHEEGTNAGKLTLLIALQASAIFAEQEEVFLVEGQRTKVVSSLLSQAFHEDAVKRELTLDIFLVGALITLFGKCGKAPEAENMFSGLTIPSVVLWTALMSAYLEQGEAIKVLQAYRQIKDEGTSLDQRIYVLSIQACSFLLEKPEVLLAPGLTMIINIGIALHSETRRGVASNIYICSALTNMYSKCERMLEAENAFNKSCVHNIVSWTALLCAYAEQGEEVKALQVYYWMQKEGINPDITAVILALRVCCTLGEREGNLVQGQTAKFVTLQIGKGLHSDCKRSGLALDIAVGSSLILMYGKCGSIVDAEVVFKELPQHNAVVCSSMLYAYVEQGLSESALQLYDCMHKSYVTLDDVMLFCILKACSDTGNLEICQAVHFGMVLAGLDSCLGLSNTLIRTYGSCASMLDGQFIADGLPHADMVTWSACMAGYAQDGSSMAGLRLLVSMQLEGNQPVGMTFLSLLTSCSHMGLVDGGFHYYESLSKDYGIATDSKHVLVMVDLLGRAGDFERIKQSLWRSPMVRDVSIWLVLLAACSRHGNKELGEQAFNCAVSLEPKKTAAYVLMANTYTETRSLVKDPMTLITDGLKQPDHITGFAAFSC